MRNTSKAVPRQALVGQNVSRPTGSPAKLSTTDLNNLMQALNIDLIGLTELLVPHGHRVELGKIDAPAIHYNLSGVGRMSINGGPKMPLSPHLLIIVPPLRIRGLGTPDANDGYFGSSIARTGLIADIKVRYEAETEPTFCHASVGCNWPHRQRPKGRLPKRLQWVECGYGRMLVLQHQVVLCE